MQNTLTPDQTPENTSQVESNIFKRFKSYAKGIAIAATTLLAIGSVAAQSSAPESGFTPPTSWACERSYMSFASAPSPIESVDSSMTWLNAVGWSDMTINADPTVLNNTFVTSIVSDTVREPLGRRDLVVVTVWDRIRNNYDQMISDANFDFLKQGVDNGAHLVIVTEWGETFSDPAAEINPFIKKFTGNINKIPEANYANFYYEDMLPGFPNNSTFGYTYDPSDPTWKSIVLTAGVFDYSSPAFPLYVNDEPTTNSHIGNIIIREQIGQNGGTLTVVGDSNGFSNSVFNGSHGTVEDIPQTKRMISWVLSCGGKSDDPTPTATTLPTSTATATSKPTVAPIPSQTPTATPIASDQQTFLPLIIRE
jgi:hypothetical protein